MDLTLDAGRGQLIDLGDVTTAKPAEVVAAALRAGLLLLADLVLDPPSEELALLLGVLPALLERGDASGLGLGRVADGLGHRRHLLGALPEDVALQLLDGALDRGELLGLRCDGRQRGGELRLQALGLVAPLAAMLAAHGRT